MNFSEIDSERRKDLEKYYKKIRKCSICKKKYGDNTNSRDRTCPICAIKLRANYDPERSKFGRLGIGLGGEELPQDTLNLT